MNLILIAFALFTSSKIQKNNFTSKVDTLSPCLCQWSYKLNFPKSALDKNISGEVVIEIKVDSSHYLSNPRVIKNLEPNCDREALRICALIIKQINECQKRCGWNNNFAAGSITQTYSFDSNE
jgi:hypothetical protein